MKAAAVHALRADEREAPVAIMVMFLLAAVGLGFAIFTGAVHGGLVNAGFILAVLGFLASFLVVLERRLRHARRGLGGTSKRRPPQRQVDHRPR